MGGYGSGRSSYRGVLEHYRRLDVNRFQREGYFLANASVSWGWHDEDGNVTASIGIRFSPDSLELHYTVEPGTDEARELRYRVEIARTRCFYGGERPWFICPNTRCQRRAGKLYLCGGYFVCRHCTGAAYASQNETPADRLLRKAHRIRAKLNASMNLSEPLWQKPKGMHWRTFERLREEEAWANHASLVMAFRQLQGMAGYSFR